MKPTAPAAPPRPQRSDGAEARARLLGAALRLFAAHGFAKTSTRAIAQEAGVNIAAISYYFGDKAGLYAAAFSEGFCPPADFVDSYTQAGQTLEEALSVFLRAYVQPLKQGETVQLCLRLNIRELLEPTAQWTHKLEQDIKPQHAGLVALLCRHLGVRQDDGVHRLAFAITALALQMFVYRDVVSAVRPSLLATPAAIDAWAAQLLPLCLALVEAERVRRAAAKAAPRTAPAPSTRGGRRPSNAP